MAQVIVSSHTTSRLARGMTANSSFSQTLRPVPVVDLRSGGPVAYAAASVAALDDLRAGCVAFVPSMARPLLPLSEALCRRWLERSASPYAEEVRAIAALSSEPGIYLGNTAYEWACTVGTCRGSGEAPVLARTLDWPFPGMGKHVTVARQAGAAGDFWNVTWPGAVGVLTATAPGRFAATINQAPLRRRTRGDLLRPLDYAANALNTYFRVRHAPPDHVLRQVFETAPDYATAKEMLCRIPVARPVLFALAGTKGDETCLIEREETTARAIEGEVIVANDWTERRDGWEERTISGITAINSKNRCAALTQRIAGKREPFDWVAPPVLNWATRVAVEMSADGLLRVVGFEPSQGWDPAIQATNMFDLAQERLAA
jgi:hypothetical protein